MLYRDAHMTGWAYKEIQEDDLKFPVVYGEGKRSRLLATIGVTRGFGDHDLKAQSSNSQVVYIKPFLTPQPEVRVLDVENEDISESDVLVMATDGLWDVVSNERVADIINNGIVLQAESKMKSSASSTSNSNDRLEDMHESTMNQSKKLVVSEEVRKKYRFISIAQELVMAARGKLVDRNWKRKVPVENGNSHNKDSTNSSAEQPQTQQVPATIDDISVFVIPILAYKEEYMQWKENRFRVGRSDNTINGSAPAENDSKTVHNHQPDLNGSTKDEDISRVHNDNLKKRGAKSEIPFSDTSDSDMELQDTPKRVKDPSEIVHPVNSKPSTSALSTNSAIGKLLIKIILAVGLTFISQQAQILI